MWCAPWVETARLLAKSILFPTRIAGLDLNKSASCNLVNSASAFRKLALSTTEYRTTNASGGFDLSMSWNTKPEWFNINLPIKCKYRGRFVCNTDLTAFSAYDMRVGSNGECS